jgi:2-succinyl-5-enolpyruvyl-6-hydroxy-3-cyclohexene-1-carboxylate synthase
VYGVEHQLIATEAQLIAACQNLPHKGVRLLEAKGDRRRDIHWLKSLFEEFTKS